jgi:hypothetical protein
LNKEAPYALDIYISNLDKPLYKIDSLVALASPARVQEKFLSFAAHHDGKVNVQSHLFEKLKKYYQLKSKAFSLAATKTEREFQKQQAAMDETTIERQDQHTTDSIVRGENSHAEEFAINLKEAYRQLGYEPTNVGSSSQTTYNVEITQTGWCNVDKYVDESVANRTTLNFTDKQTGRKAVITYTSASFSIDQANSYDRIYFYLLPDKLNGSVKLDATASGYSYKLDELIKYNAFCLAYTKEQAFFCIQKGVLPGSYPPIKLTAATDKDITKALAEMVKNHQAADISDEIDYRKFEMQDISRRRSRLDAERLKYWLIDLILKCTSIPPEEGVGVPVRGPDQVRK